MDQMLQALTNGVLIGGVYAVLSVGLALIFGVMGIVNFAQAEFVMLGMYAAFVLNRQLGLDPILSAPLVFCALFLFGAGVQRLLVQRVLREPLVSQIFLTIGLSLVLVSSAQLAFGATYQSVITPYQTEALKAGSITISVPYLYAFTASVVFSALLWTFLERTDLGRSMRATSQNRTAAILMGVNPERMFAIAFGLGAGLAGVAGAIILPYAYVYPACGSNYALMMFTVVVLGGLGSVPGALLGGLIVGVLHSVSALMLPTQLQNAVVFVILLTMLTFRPSGIFGVRT